jgi:hypothetical protein
MRQPLSALLTLFFALPAASQSPFDRTIIDIDVRNAPLDEVMRFLSAAANLEFELSEDVLDEMESDRFRIHLKLHDVPVKTVLNLVSNLLDLSIVLTDRTLRVETTEERGSERRTVKYDVADLLIQLQEPPTSGSRTDEESEACVVFAEERAWRHPDWFVDLVMRSAGSLTWWQEGASISLKDGVLTVVNNSDVIKQVEELLAALRRFR